MKLQLPLAGPGRDRLAGQTAAFTMPEMLVAVAVFLLLVAGIVGSNVFGLRMYQITENKLKATDSARNALGKMTDEIRTSSSTLLGNVTNGVFYARLDGEVQTGSGILIYPTTNTSSFITYFVNPSDQSFRRTTSTPGATAILARTVTNYATAFRAEDYQGNVLTNNQNNRVIHVILEYYQSSRTNVAADYYKLESSVARRGL